MDLLTFDRIYNEQQENAKAQKNHLVFIIMAPVLAFFGFGFARLIGAFLLVAIMGIICIVRSNVERSKLKNLKNGNFVLEKDVLIKKYHTSGHYSYSRKQHTSSSWKIQSERLYKRPFEIRRDFFERLEEGDEFVAVMAGGKLVSIYSLRTNTISPELLSKVKVGDMVL